MGWSRETPTLQTNGMLTMLARTTLRFTGAALAAITLLSADLFASTDPQGMMMVMADGPPPAQTPEIDPALAGGALTLLLGGVLILTDMLRKKEAPAS